MPRPQLLQLCLVFVLAVTSAASAQVPVLPDRLQDPPDTASYPTLLRRLDGARGMDRSFALGRMRRSYPDSARAWALRHIRTMGGFSAAVAAYAILGDSAEGLTILMGLLPGLPDSVLVGLAQPLADAIHRAGTRPDSLQRVLFRSGNGGMRALAMRIFSADIDDRPIAPDERELLDQGTRDRDPKVRAAALGAIAWRVPRSDTAGKAWAHPYFVAGLFDVDAEVRTEALHDISWRGLRVPGSIERIRAIARGPRSERERRAAVLALGVQREAGLVAVPDLLTYLRGRDEELGRDALSAITELARDGVPMGAEVRHEVRAYRERQENPYYELDVVRSLAALRDTGALVDLITHRDTIVARGALLALTGVAPEHPAVFAALDDPRPDIVEVAIGGAVPVLFRDSSAIHPRTTGGVTARDSAQTLARALRRSGLVGRCFEITWGKYDPPINLGADSVYTKPPRVIAFLADPGAFPAYRGYGGRIAQANGAAHSVGPGMWSWDPEVDSLSAAWSTGFSGVSLVAGWDGGMLRGRMGPFWDFPGPQLEAEVRLSPVECRSIDPDPTGDD